MRSGYLHKVRQEGSQYDVSTSVRPLPRTGRRERMKAVESILGQGQEFCLLRPLRCVRRWMRATNLILIRSAYKGSSPREGVGDDAGNWVQGQRRICSAAVADGLFGIV